MIDEKNIPLMSRDELLESEVFLSLFDIEAESERKRIEVLLTLRASDLGIEKHFISIFSFFHFFSFFFY